MEKILNYFLFLFIVVVISCDKEVETTPLKVDNFPKATIKGYVYADLDQTSYGYEKVPTGTKVIVTMPYSELGITSGGNLVITVEIQSDGTFEFTVPVDANGANVSVKIVDFIYDQLQTQQYNSKLTTIKKVFYGETVTYNNVKPGDVQIQQIYIVNTEQIGEAVTWYTISGKIVADRDKSTPGNEVIPSGTQVIFNCDGWSQVITIGNDGVYSVNVPEKENIYIEYNFTTSGKRSDGTSVNLRFKGEQFVGYFTDDKENININLGVGEEI